MTADNSAATRQRNANWAATRLKGKAHFVWYRGVLGWGAPMYAIMAVVPALTHRVAATPFYFVWQAGLWGAAGALFGVVMWNFSERQFRKANGRQAP